MAKAARIRADRRCDADGYLITPLRRGDLLDLAGVFADAIPDSARLSCEVPDHRL